MKRANINWILSTFLFALLMLSLSAQAYFISSKVPFSPSSNSNITYFLGDYVSNETLLYPDKIYLDGTWVVMHTTGGTINSTVMKINDTYQHYNLENSTSDLNLSLNTSGWEAGATMTLYANDTGVSITVSNTTGWINVIFRNVTSGTTKLTIILTAHAPIPPPPSSGLMVEEDNIIFRISVGWLEIYLVLDDVHINLETGEAEV